MRVVAVSDQESGWAVALRNLHSNCGHTVDFATNTANHFVKRCVVYTVMKSEYGAAWDIGSLGLMITPSVSQIAYFVPTLVAYRDQMYLGPNKYGDLRQEVKI